MTQTDLLQLFDTHFSCLSVQPDPSGKGLRLISESGRDVTQELHGFMQELLCELAKSPYQPTSEIGGGSRRGHLCVVDDDEFFLVEIVDFFVNSGYEVNAFLDGKAALAAIEQTPFDLVLSDVEMPKMNGLDLLKNIKACQIKVPFVLMSGSSIYAQGDQHLKMGAVDFFEKPISLVALERRVAALLAIGN